MAEALEEFDWNAARSPRSRYDWDEWFDGRIWRLVEGEDFTAKASSFRTSVSAAAQRRGQSVRTSIPEDGVVVLQAYEEADSE